MNQAPHFWAPLSTKCFQLVSLLILNVISISTFAAPNAVLIADLNTHSRYSSSPENFIEYKGKLYFSAESRPFGHELWVYDGIAATMIADINTDGYQSSNPKQFTVLNDKLYFVADTANNGAQLFVYDGHSVELAFDAVSLGLSYPDDLVAFNNKLYFSANNPTYGDELHEFDPESGVVSVPEDVIPGTSGTHARDLIVFNNKLYYYGQTQNNGSEVWQFDGTQHTQFFDVHPGSSSSSIEHPMIFNNALYFKAKTGSSTEELVRITAGGVVEQVTHIGQNGSWAGTREMTEHQGKLYFRAKEDSSYQLWRYDGSTVELVSDASQPSITTPYHLASYGEHLYFRTSDKANLIGGELWRYSEASGIELVEDYIAGFDGAYPSDMIVYQNKLLFSLSDPATGRELFQYDGSAISLAAEMNVSSRSSNPQHAMNYKNKMVFSAKITDSDRDLALLEYDGVNAPRVIQNFTTDKVNISNYTGNKVVLNDVLYFVTVDEVRGSSLWSYDGLSVSAVTPSNFYVSGWLASFNGYVYFAADDGSGVGHELWRTDGVNAPELVFDINPGSASSYVNQFSEMQGKLYFVAESAAYGQELWQYDGINPPTIASDIIPGASSSRPTEFAVFENKLYFQAMGLSEGQELWAFDGVNPASLVADIVPSWSSSSPRALTVFNGYLYFSANNNSLYRYSSASGVELVADINPAGDDGTSEIHAFNDTLYFSAHSGDYDHELWQFTESGGAQLAVNVNTISGSSPRNFFSFNNELYFAAYNQQNWGMEYGVELHKLSFSDTDTRITLDSHREVTLHDRFNTPQEAIKAFEFTLTDAGSSDALPSVVYDLRMHARGTMPVADRLKVDWVLVDEADNATAGFYDDVTHHLYFPVDPIYIDDGGSKSFTLYAYFIDNKNLADGKNIQFSLHSQADLLFDPNTTQPNGSQAVSPLMTVDVNYAPVANNGNIVIAEDNSTNISVTASDADNDSLDYLMVRQPRFGVLSGSLPNLLYTPNSDF